MGNNDSMGMGKVEGANNMTFLRRLMERWEMNKIYQKNHYFRIEHYLEEILEIMKGGVKDGKRKRKRKR